MHQIPQNIEEAKTMCKNWNTIYPAYINKKYSVAQGRRVAIELAVESPSVEQISECLQTLKIHHIVELDKNYCKDFFSPGRIKVYIKNQDGVIYNPLYPNKKKILRNLGPLMQELQNKKQKEKEQQAEQQTHKKNKKKKK